MEPRFQKRVQRYGWDRAAGEYESAWRAQLEPAQSMMLEMAAPKPGERVLDVACGTGLVTFRALQAVGESGTIVGTDISGAMVATAARLADERGYRNVSFQRLDAEDLDVTSPPFDVALCGLGLMYVPHPGKALEEMLRLLRAGGRAAVAVWGARARCGWAEIFPITDARVASAVCPLFFQLGTGNAMADAFSQSGFRDVRLKRLNVDLVYETAREALCAAFRGGPVALAYNRFDESTRNAVHNEYLASIEPYRAGEGYRVPGEFVVVSGVKPM